MRISIRPAEVADRPAIEAASRQTWAEHAARQPTAFREDGWDMSMQRPHEIAFRDAEANQTFESGNLFVAETDAGIVGFILLSWHAGQAQIDHPTGSIDDIWVHPDWRHKGIAREMLDLAKSIAEDRDWDSLTARTWEGAPSADLFEKAGFERQSTTWRIGPDRPPRPLPPQEPQSPIAQKHEWIALAAILGFLVLLVIFAG